MKIFLEVNNKTSWRFSKKILKTVFEKTLDVSGISCLSKKTVELSVAFVDEGEIKELNFRYRKKNNPTDVLSFSEFETDKHICEDKNGHIFLGELVVCPDYVARGAKEDGETFEYAMSYIISHGILHLLGFSHGPKMFKLQEGVADQVAK